MTNEDLVKLAKYNLDFFQNDTDLAEYLAFLFSELAKLDSDFCRTLELALEEMESE